MFSLIRFLIAIGLLVMFEESTLSIVIGLLVVLPDLIKYTVRSVNSYK